MTQFGQGDYTGAIDNAGGVLLNFAIAADITRSLAGIPNGSTPINPWTLRPRAGVGEVADRTAAESIGEVTAPAVKPFETVESLVTTEEGLTLPSPPKSTGLSCFPAGTSVATASGPKPIESVVEGELVWAYDLISSSWKLRRVLRTYSRPCEGNAASVTVAGETIDSTSRRPYFVVQGDDLEGRPSLEHRARVPEGATTRCRWVDVGDLRVGD